jgi:hypothetical protein
MTDPKQMPERIWAETEIPEYTTQPWTADQVEYIRADLVPKALDVEAAEIEIARMAHPIIDLLDLPEERRSALALALAIDVRRVLTRAIGGNDD